MAERHEPRLKLSSIHKRSSYHRDDLEKSDLCGCFYCLRIYPPAEITRWCDGPDDRPVTAICPHCGIDSVLPGAAVDLSRELLAKLKRAYFGV